MQLCAEQLLVFAPMATIVIAPTNNSRRCTTCWLPRSAWDSFGGRRAVRQPTIPPKRAWAEL